MLSKRFWVIATMAILSISPVIAQEQGNDVTVKDAQKNLKKEIKTEGSVKIKNIVVTESKRGVTVSNQRILIELSDGTTIVYKAAEGQDFPVPGKEVHKTLSRLKKKSGGHTWKQTMEFVCPDGKKMVFHLDAKEKTKTADGEIPDLHPGQEVYILRDAGKGYLDVQRKLTYGKIIAFHGGHIFLQIGSDKIIDATPNIKHKLVSVDGKLNWINQSSKHPDWCKGPPPKRWGVVYEARKDGFWLSDGLTPEQQKQLDKRFEEEERRTARITPEVKKRLNELQQAIREAKKSIQDMQEEERTLFETK